MGQSNFSTLRSRVLAGSPDFPPSSRRKAAGAALIGALVFGAAFSAVAAEGPEVADPAAWHSASSVHAPDAEGSGLPWLLPTLFLGLKPKAPKVRNPAVPEFKSPEERAAWVKATLVNAPRHAGGPVDYKRMVDYYESIAPLIVDMRGSSSEDKALPPGLLGEEIKAALGLSNSGISEVVTSYKTRQRLKSG